MPFRHGYKRKRYIKPTRRFTRSKVGYRKYSGKASSVRTRQPARFRFSRRNYRLNTAVARTIRGMAETKIIPFRQINWQQPVQAGTAAGISRVKFIAGSTATGSYGSYTPIGGFNAPQGDTKNDRDGQFIFLKGSTVNLTVAMDHVTNVRPSAIQFRVIVFRPKRALDPSGITLNPDLNLFLRNDGSNFGDATAVPNNMNPMDMMLQPINTNSFTIACDKKFTLQHPSDQDGTNPLGSPIQTNLKSIRNLRLHLVHNTKARIPISSTDEPIDYNYRYAMVVYASWANQAATTQTDLPISYSVSVRGTTGFNDV